MGEEKAHDDAEGGKQQALGEELSNDPHAASSQRSPHRYLLLARARPRQKEAGNIGARNEQDEANQAH